MLAASVLDAPLNCSFHFLLARLPLNHATWHMCPVMLVVRPFRRQMRISHSILVMLIFIFSAYVCSMIYLRSELVQYCYEDNIKVEFQGIGFVHVDRHGKRHWFPLYFKSNEAIVAGFKGIGTAVYPWNWAFVF